MFKVNNKDTRTTPLAIEHISHLFLVFFIVNFEQVNAGWVKNEFTNRGDFLNAGSDAIIFV